MSSAQVLVNVSAGFEFLSRLPVMMDRLWKAKLNETLSSPGCLGQGGLLQQEQ